ncbi:ATP-dependent bile acid permease [Venturia inaequalis]|nr:ATP-dependent bile acid permease [Venturia inaequalis]
MFPTLSPANYPATSLLLMGLLSPLVSSHMELSQPLPQRSQFNPALSGGAVDYNLKSPLAADGSNFPCHGYQNDPFVSAATYTAGKTYQMALSGTTTHGGGSCQLSLSYDNGGTFKVIKSMVGGCPLTQQYDFTIPSFAPTGNALFAWTWFNEIGNREMYMNCAFVQIVGSSTTRRSRTKRQSAITSMNSLPNIWRANIAGLDQCATVEGSDPVFPNLGPDVVYGGRSSESSPKDTQQGCDSSSPSGQTFQGSNNAGTSSQSSTAQLLNIATTSTLASSVTATPEPTITNNHDVGNSAASAGNSSSSR